MTHFPEDFGAFTESDFDSPMPPTGNHEVTFRQLSRERTSQYAASLAILANDVTAVYALPEASSLLSLSEEAGIGGVTYAVHGLVGIKPQLLHKPEAAVFTGVHEAVHARLGNSVAEKATDEVAPGFRKYYHDVLVPAWVRGDVEFAENQEYILYRGYDGLVPDGWNGPHAVTETSAEATLRNYFLLVARDMIEETPSGKFTHVDMQFRSWADQLARHPVHAPEHFSESPQRLVNRMITGFGVGEHLLGYSRNNRDIDLLDWEEGLANRIASDLTGMSLETMQAIVAQDESKIKRARQLGSAGLSGQQLAEEIQTYDDLYNLVKAHF